MPYTTSPRLRLEALESRLTPTVSLSQKGNLFIQATNANDVVTVRQVFADGIAYHEVTENGVATRVKSEQIIGPYVYFYGYDGADRFENHTPLAAVAHGGTGDDYLYSLGGGFLEGESGNDTLIAGRGTVENALRGGAGDDVLIGSAGRDLLYGDDGQDRITCGGGNDYAEGGPGNDVIDGGDGADVIHGGGGNDTIGGGLGNDQLDGGDGNDSVTGHAGDDTLWGRAGNDSLVGGDGNDGLYGGAGVDSLYGLHGNDQLVGGSGNDRLFGGMGLDYLWGEDGNDLLDGGQEGLADYLDGGSGKDTLRREVYRVGTSTQQRERMPDYVVGLDVLYT